MLESRARRWRRLGTQSKAIAATGVADVAPQHVDELDVFCALAPKWRYCGVVPSIQVKDVPDEVHATLRRRAAVAGMSLQEYLLARLEDEANTPTLAEVLDRAGGRAGGGVSLEAAVEAVRADRDGR